jgi:hypothetical protein
MMVPGHLIDWSAHMARPTKLLVFLGLFSLLGSRVLADDLASSFEVAASRGEAQERAASTRGYFTKILLPYYGQKYAPVLQSCFTNVPKPDNSRFSFVAAIGADGRVVRVYRDRETNIFQCMRESLEKDIFPKPPVFPYYLHIEMNFADEDAPVRDSKENPAPLIVEPNKYSYTFSVPQGWAFSFEQAQEFGVRIVFFPKNGDFHTSRSVIYVSEVNTVCNSNCAGAISLAIAKTIRETRDDSPSVRVAVEHPLRIMEGGEAQVRVLTGLRDPRQVKEALAFIEHNEAIVLVVLTTGDTKTWEQDYRVFQAVVSGHKFFTCGSAGLATPCRQ